MTRLTLGSLVAERTYEWRTAGTLRRITVRIGKPIRDPQPRGDWLCPVQFIGAPVSARFPRGVRPVYGVDALQALVLALGYVQKNLEVLQRYGEGTPDLAGI